MLTESCFLLHSDCRPSAGAAHAACHHSRHRHEIRNSASCTGFGLAALRHPLEDRTERLRERVELCQSLNPALSNEMETLHKVLNTLGQLSRGKPRGYALATFLPPPAELQLGK